MLSTRWPRLDSWPKGAIQISRNLGLSWKLQFSGLFASNFPFFSTIFCLKIFKTNRKERDQTCGKSKLSAWQKKQTKPSLVVSGYTSWIRFMVPDHSIFCCSGLRYQWVKHIHRGIQHFQILYACQKFLSKQPKKNIVNLSHPTLEGWFASPMMTLFRLSLGTFFGASQSHDGSMVLLYMVTWIPSIYPQC